jgi:hypothetical protein
MRRLAGVEFDEKRYTTNTGGGSFFDQSWKASPEERLDATEAHDYLLKHEGDPGTHAVAFIFKQGDRFHAVDEDNESIRHAHDERFKPTLRVRSRSGGTHLYYSQPDDAEREVLLNNIDAPEKWAETGTIADFRNTNITKLMYAPGSYRPAGKVPDDEVPVYTVENIPEADELPPLGMRELPTSWLRALARKKYDAQKRREANSTSWDSMDVEFNGSVDGERSALFDLDDKKVYARLGGDVSGEKHAHPLHGSKTGKNAEFNEENNVVLCWHNGHECTHNALSLLALASEAYDDDSDCGYLGTDFGNGPSGIENNPKAAFWAWVKGCRLDILNRNDSVPYRALMWATVEAGYRDAADMFAPAEYEPGPDGTHLSANEFNGALEWLQEKAPDVDLGRDKVEYAEGAAEKYIAQQTAEHLDLSADEHATIQGCARAGKSYEVMKSAYTELIAGNYNRGCYVAPSHQEAQATWQKAVDMGIDAAYVGGREWAKSGWGENNRELNYSSDEYPERTAKTPWKALDKIDGSKNQYQGLIEGAKEADFVVLPPEKLEAVTTEDNTFDLVITSEENVLDRLVSESVTVFTIQRTGSKTGVSIPILDSLAGTAEVMIERINDLERTDRIHEDMLQVAEFVIELGDMIKESGIESWSAGEDTFRELVSDVRDKLAELTPQADFHATRKRLRNKYPGHYREFINLLYHDPDPDKQGVLTRSDGNKKSIDILGDTDRLFQELPPDATYWFAGNDISLMSSVHRLAHNDAPEPVRYMNDFTPVTRSIEALKLDTDASPNEQAAHVAEIIESPKVRGASGIMFGGSKRRAKRAKSRVNKVTVAPENVDRLADIRKQAGVNNVALSLNSKFAEGVDLEPFEYTALHTGRFKTPRENYIAEKTGDPTAKYGELIRATQNAALRASDVPDPEKPEKPKGTGKTPALIPDKQVPDALFAMLEAFDIETHTVETIEDATNKLHELIRESSIGGITSETPELRDESVPDVDKAGRADVTDLLSSEAAGD